MSENFNSHIACEGTDNDINWVCKVCKDLPNYAGMYLYQREREKNQLKNVKDRRADLILLKYYYALLHLLDKIHELHECPNPEKVIQETGLRSWNGFVINGTVMISSISSTV